MNEKIQTPATDKAASTAHQTVDKVAASAAQAEARLREVAAELEGRLQNTGAKARLKSNSVTMVARDFMAEHPAASLGIAFAAGIVAAGLLRHK